MNYKVLYRKYRPNSFDGIVGQNYVIETLINSIKNETISHAYIFSGPRGTGKTSTAKIFANAINCVGNNAEKPCGKCEFCTNLVENPDIIEIDAASNNGVDQIRELIDNVKITPTNGKYKVYIIDEVHMLTTSAFNALLLTLEEPPSHVIFILATTNIESVPITILSRCQRFDFKRIDNDTLVLTMKNICKKEKISITDDALQEIAYLSDGGMRDSLSLLDQLSKKGEKITLDIVENQIKTVSKKNIEDFIDTIENNNVSEFINKINDFKVRSVDYKVLIKKLIDSFSKRAINIKNTSKIIRLSFNDYKNLILELSDIINKISINIDPYTILEMIILNYFDSVESEKVYKKEDIKEKKEDIIENKEIIVNNIDDEFISIRVNNAFVDATKDNLLKVKELVNIVCNDSKTDGKIKSILLDNEAVLASNEYVVFSCINDHSATSLNENLENVENSFNMKNKTNYKFVFISNMRWEKEKNKFINNKKNNIRYEYIEEKKIAKGSTEPKINEVFDSNIVEII